MKFIQLVITLLMTASFVACTPPAAPAATQDGEPTQPAVPVTGEEAEIRALVDNFGKRLQLVSLLAPTAAQDLQNQYAEFVSPTLLDAWVSDVSTAPGRMVSSPWPDRIEITGLSREAPDRYVVDGFVIEMTSMEIASGEAANKIPVQLVAEKVEGRWLITEYMEER